MKAVVYERYGGPDVLLVREVDPPKVKDHGVLIRVHAAAVNPYDLRGMRGKPLLLRLDAGLRRPKAKILGVDVAGVVESVGPHASRFRPGDEVFGGVANGAFAEFVTTTGATLTAKPPNLTFHQAAAVPGSAWTALQALRDGGRLQQGDHVLVVGASGGVGTFAVQLAKHLGAEVTGVCSRRTVDLVRSLGADHVIDYTRDDFAENRHRYDVLLDAVGNRPLSACRRVLRTGGRYVAITGRDGPILGPVARYLRIVVASRLVDEHLCFFFARPDLDDLMYLRDLLANGSITPVLDKVYPLDRAPDAVNHLKQRHIMGKIVISMTADNASSSSSGREQTMGGTAFGRR
jgi:NADPH:quinone reductase-like Zn-dependent oxidoreductase